MVIIKFASGRDWYKANWVFRQFASDLLYQSGNDPELVPVMAEAGGIGALFLDKMPADRCIKMLRLMAATAERTLSKEIPSWRGTHPADDEGYVMYLGAIGELLELVRGEKID